MREIEFVTFATALVIFLCVAHWHNTQPYNINIFLTLYWIFKQHCTFSKPINICRVENYGPYLHIHCSKFWQWSIRCSIFSLLWKYKLSELSVFSILSNKLLLWSYVLMIVFHFEVRYVLSEWRFLFKFVVLGI